MSAEDFKALVDSLALFRNALVKTDENQVP